METGALSGALLTTRYKSAWTAFPTFDVLSAAPFSLGFCFGFSQRAFTENCSGTCVGTVVGVTVGGAGAVGCGVAVGGGVVWACAIGAAAPSPQSIESTRARRFIRLTFFLFSRTRMAVVYSTEQQK